MKITDLISSRNVIIQKMDNYLADKTALTEEEAAVYAEMEKELNGVTALIEKLQAQDALNKKLAAPTSEPILDGVVAAPVKENGFSNFLKTGKVQNDALSLDPATAGGYLCPDEFEKTLIEELDNECVVRGLCHKISTNSGDRKIPVVASHAQAYWTSENEDYTESEGSYGQITLSAHKETTLSKASEELVNDAVFNIEAQIQKDFVRAFALKEEDAFLNGDGDEKPLGMLAATGGVDVGVTAAATNKITADEIIDLVYSLKECYRKKASFLMSNNSVKAVRKLKDGTGNYIWQQSFVAGQPSTLCGYPVHVSDAMPEIATGNKAILFGDFEKAYWIADRKGITVQRLNELFAGKGQIGYKAYKRVDGKTVLPEAVKALKLG